MSSMDYAAASRPKRTTTHKDVETTEQTHRRIGGGLRGGLDHRGDSPVGSASVGTGKYSVGGFCRRARVDLSAVAVFQHFLGLAGGIRDPAHDRRALHLRENAARDLGERFFPFRAIITTVLPTVRSDFYWCFRFGNSFCGLAESD